MNFPTIIEICVVSGAVGLNLYASLCHTDAKAKLDRARQFYEDCTPKSFGCFASKAYHYNEGPHEAQATQLCGGCGLNLTQDQIASCTGESCPLYLGNVSSPLYMDADIPAGTTTKKINIGYKGYLHTDR